MLFISNTVQDSACTCIDHSLHILAFSSFTWGMLPLALRGSKEGKSVLSQVKDFYFYMATYRGSPFYAVWLYKLTTTKYHFHLFHVEATHVKNTSELCQYSKLQNRVFSFNIDSQKKYFSVSNEQVCRGLLLRIRDCDVSSWHGVLCITQMQKDWYWVRHGDSSSRWNHLWSVDSAGEEFWRELGTGLLEWVCILGKMKYGDRQRRQLRLEGGCPCSEEV